MATKTIRAQVTTRVVRPGDPLAFGAKGTPTPPPPPGFALYQFVISRDNDPPPGEAWAGPGAIVVNFNEVDFDGTNVRTFIAGLVAGDQLVVQSVPHLLSDVSVEIAPGIWEVYLSAPTTFPAGLYEVYIVKGTP